MSDHFSVDRIKIEVGGRFWNNDLRVCEITEVAAHSNDYPGGYTQTWHRTTHGSFDTVAPYNQFLGRLVRWYEGVDATKFEPGTTYQQARCEHPGLFARPEDKLEDTRHCDRCGMNVPVASL